jgi:electron transfer flavoprotein beta subunit
MNTVRIDRATGKPVFGEQMVISSYDVYAVEEALRLKETHGGEVMVLAAGPPSVKDALTRALAMGADRAVLIDAPMVNALDTLAVAGLLADQLRGGEFDLILAGQTADDSETGQVGPQLAELLNLPLISNVIGLDIEGDRIVVRRDTEDGQQTVETSLPVVLLASTGLNTPRFPSLKGIMGAKRKPLETVPGTAEAAGRISWGEPFVPERTVAGTLLQNVPPAEAAKQLVAWLKEQKLI